MKKYTRKLACVHNPFHPYDQFIIQKNKIPSDYRTGQPANAHEQQVWADRNTAERAVAFFGAGYGLGFVFADSDPFWFLDIDKCLVNGVWSPLALEMCTLFAGCYMEVSQSGTGLHIVGSGEVPAHGCRNKELGLEFYTTGRYMALGHNAQGDPNFKIDSAIMLAFVNKYFPPEVEEHEGVWQEGHELGWELPGDDELIQVGMRVQGAGIVFGGKASFKDLWFADTEELGKHYPHPEKPYDASSADMALASKLAWLTGNDCPRIERMMWKSQLKRDKWETHKTYLGGFTIPRALVRDSSFYDPKFYKRQAEQKAVIKAIGDGGSASSLSPSLGLDEMLDRFVNVIEGKRVFDVQNPKCIMNQDEFVNAYKSSKTSYNVPGEYKNDGTAKVKQMDTAKLWAEDTRRRRVQSITFRPSHPLETEDPDGKHAINTWRSIERSGEVGDCSIFTRHIDYLFGNDSSRFLDWLAHIEQKPGVLPHTGWVHISPMHGTGRNWLSWTLALVWKGYVATSFDLAGTLKNGYNGSLSCKLLAVVDEINEGGSSARWENAEVLKSIVTPAFRSINPKYGYQRVEFNCCRWLIFSNHTSALPLAEGDRRFNVVQNNCPPLPEQYYKELYGSLESPGFVESVANMLKARDISGFNPGAHALLNEAKRDLIGSSRTETDEILQDLIANHPSDVIANSTLATILNGGFGTKNSLVPHQKHAAQRAGIISYGGVWIAPSTVRVSILRNHQLWKSSTPDQVKTEMGKFSFRP